MVVLNEKLSTGDENIELMSTHDVENKFKPTSFFSLFKFASRFDKQLIAIGIMFGIASGVIYPFYVILMSELSDTFIEYSLYNQLLNDKYRLNSTNQTLHSNVTQFVETSYMIPHFKELKVRLKLPEETFAINLKSIVFENSTFFVDDFKKWSSIYCVLLMCSALLLMVCIYILVTTLSIAAINQIHRIRIKFFEAILKQDMKWFDTKSSGDFASKITSDLDKIQNGIGDKVALCLHALVTLLFSLGTALYYGWKLTLVILSLAPILIIIFSIILKFQAKHSTKEIESYSKASAIAEEVLAAIRTVYTFGGQNKEILRYETNLESAKQSGVRRIMFTALSQAIMSLFIYCSYALAFWYGIKLIIRSIEEEDLNYETSNLLTVFFSIMAGLHNMSQTTHYFDAIMQARGAASLIYQVIERKPDIDCSSKSGDNLNDISGRVELRNVYFNYPSRPDMPVLSGLSLLAEPGQTIALVGPSGCGKSTIIQLIQRFYDINEGQVLIDDRDIRELNVGSLREHIGVVGQEPVLFSTSIAENIKLGYSDAIQEDIELAATDANANDFIMGLPNQFNTLVGERGSQLSGGQKQRIAIARALIKRPKILLLDESTSALDMQSEFIVEAALHKARVGRTTFIVAHRLSTIRSADKIIVINNGRVEEEGTHDQLIKKGGLYYKLVKVQKQTEVLDTTENEQELYPARNREFIDCNDRNNSNDSEMSEQHLSINRVNSPIVKVKERAPLKRLYVLLKPDKWLLMMGILMTFMSGLSTITFSILYGELLGSLSNPDTEQIEKDVDIYCFYFIGIGLTSGFASFFQVYIFGIFGERLTKRIRKMLFTSMLRQEIEWFDKSDNSTGALCSRLSSDPSCVQTATGSRLSVFFQAFFILLTGMSITLYYNWKLALIVISYIPVLIVITYFQMKTKSDETTKDIKSQEEASRIAVEAISSIRTVASLHKESKFLLDYIRALQTESNKWKIRVYFRSFILVNAMNMPILFSAIILFYGSRLIIDGKLEYKVLYKIMELNLPAALMIGNVLAFAQDYHKGKLALINIFKIFDKLPNICVDTIGDKPSICEGELEMLKIEFTYPTRPDVKILRGLSFDVTKGQTIALVGSSGCGKSTIIQLIQRFYDSDNGVVLLDNRNIENLNISWLRHKLGIVSQEPVLLSNSIADNIAYGDNTRTVEVNEIVRASQKANIHDFIKELPKGFDTLIGDKDTQLSGGQKQRIAIARALVRDPEILILDEATSSLDSESEYIVQKALDEARQERTCIVIAHRLSTIYNVDKIVVVNRGRVVEEGTHQELINRRGAYFELYNSEDSNQ